MVKQSGGNRRQYQATHRFVSLTRSQLHDKKCANALLRRQVTIPVTIHEKMSTLWQKGVGSEQLREEVQVKYGTSYHRYYMRMLEQVGTNEFEIQITYKSPRGIHRVTYTSIKYMLLIDMELFIISAQGVSSRAVIWPMEKKDSLTRMELTTVGVPHKTASTQGMYQKRGDTKQNWSACRRTTQGQVDEPQQKGERMEKWRPWVETKLLSHL